MLSIDRRIVERKIQIRDFFYELGLEIQENAEFPNNFDVDVLSHSESNDHYQRIEGFHCTEILPIQRLVLETRQGRLILECAQNHRVLCENQQWKHVSALTDNDVVFVLNEGWCRIIENALSSDSEILFDLQVANTHCFYTNYILSHNSHFLVQIGANAMRAGKNVLHYTFELRENKVGIRYDSNFCGISATDVPTERDYVKKTYDGMQDKLGRLIIKEYPTNSATVVTLRAHIEKLAITKGFIPDVIIVDYADIMRSTRQYDSLRHEQKLVYEELRGLGMELGLPIWTASQSNRDSTDSDVVGLDKISEAFGKAMVCDFIVSLSRKPLQKANGLGNLFIPKNRLGKDGVLFPVRLDTARSILEVLDNNIDLEEFQKTRDNSMKQLLRDTWNELAEDRLIEMRDDSKKAVNGGEE